MLVYLMESYVVAEMVPYLVENMVANLVSC